MNKKNNHPFNKADYILIGKTVKCILKNIYSVAMLIVFLLSLAI